MGNWSITINGHGIHDNGRDDDADAMVLAFIEELKARGHDVSSAHFVVGTDRALMPGGEWRLL